MGGILDHGVPHQRDARIIGEGLGNECAVVIGAVLDRLFIDLVYCVPALDGLDVAIALYQAGIAVVLAQDAPSGIICPPGSPQGAFIAPMGAIAAKRSVKREASVQVIMLPLEWPVA